MPTIACPGCGKQYKLPASAAGQVAKCACGKKFKVGGAPTVAAAPKPSPIAATSPATPGVAKQPVSAAKSASPVKAKPAAAPSAPSARSIAPPVPAIDDDFWEEGLKEPVKPAAKLPVAEVSHGTGRPQPVPDAASKKRRKKKSGGIKWGFDWGKVAGGLATFVLAGGFTLFMVLATDRIYFWPAGVAIVGLFTALSGLMGEDGVW